MNLCGLLNCGGALVLAVIEFVAKARRPSGHCTSASSQYTPLDKPGVNVYTGVPKAGSCPAASQTIRAELKFVSATCKVTVTGWPARAAPAGTLMVALVN